MSAFSPTWNVRFTVVLTETATQRSEHLPLFSSSSLFSNTHSQKKTSVLMATMKKESVKTMETMPNKGAWTAEEDRKLAEVIATHGAKRWRTIASKAGNTCTYFVVYFILFFLTKEINNLRPKLNYVCSVLWSNSSLMCLWIFAALNRCGKSCRLRWLNYLRPNIKRGNISDQEEDLILRLHKLLGNR